MKIETKQSEIRTSKQFTELQFGIREADCGLILEILRSKMYKNPIAAICREVSSNSRDANREAENNIPIQISILDNKLLSSDMTIQFKDNGPGISPDRMANVFINYGASTKRDSNEFTGGFGLGAKTPFSYADNFAIETINNGTHYSWICAVEEGRKGKIYLIDSHETSEPSGTTIIVPIKQGDRDTFEREVFKATVFWPMKPIYNNFKIKIENLQLETIYEDEKYLIVKQNFFNSQYALLLDGILYSIDQGIMNFSNRIIYDHLIIFKFTTGDLTISANREALQYDDKTKTTIQTRFNELLVLCYNEYKKDYDVNNNWLQAALFYSKRNENVFYKIVHEHSASLIDKLSSFKGGMSLTANLSSIFPSLQFYKCEIDYEKVTRTKTNDVNEYLKSWPNFLFDETSSYHLYKEKTIFTANKKYVAIKPMEPKVLRWKELTFKEKKGLAKEMRSFVRNVEKLSEAGFTYSNYSTVEKAKVSKDPADQSSLPRTRQPDTIRVCVRNFQANNTSYSYMTPDSESIKYQGSGKLDATKFALELIDDVQRPPEHLSEELQMIQIAIKMRLIPEFEIVYANKNRGKILVPHIKPLSSFMSLLTPMVITQIIDGFHIKQITDSELDSVLLKFSFISKEFSEVTSKINKAMFVTSVKTYVPGHLITKYQHLSQFKEIASEFAKIKTTCPLVERIQLYRYSDEDKKNMNYYINLIETDLIKKGLLK